MPPAATLLSYTGEQLVHRTSRTEDFDWQQMHKVKANVVGWQSVMY